MSGVLAHAGMRLLTAADEVAFLSLLRSVYGETYSYKSLYEPCGFTQVVEAPDVRLWGDFDANGVLLGHTGIFYRESHAESGMSFRRPKASPNTASTEGFSRILAEAKTRVALLHQNTTTRHRVAQRFAERTLGAKPTGLIVAYAEATEHIRGLPESVHPMNAITMTTCLKSDALWQGRLRLPRGPFQQWLAARFTAYGIATELQSKSTHALRTFDVTQIEYVPDLDLARYRVLAPEDGPPEHPPRKRLAHGGHRIELVHVALDSRASYMDVLSANGYVPVGIRLSTRHAHEVVFQWLSREARERVRVSLCDARMIPSCARVAQTWSEVFDQLR